MAAVKIYKLRCDGAIGGGLLCPAEFTFHGEFSATAARRAAGVIGWTSYVEQRANRAGPVRTIDLCSTHAKGK